MGTSQPSCCGWGWGEMSGVGPQHELVRAGVNVALSLRQQQEEEPSGAQDSHGALRQHQGCLCWQPLPVTWSQKFLLDA